MLKNSISILLVEDESFTSDIIKKRLQQIPDVTSVTCCPNGISARNYILENVVDIVITDIMMPFMDGIELSAFLSTFDPVCKIVIISGYNEFEYARKALQYGVKDYLLKPVKFLKLVDVVEKCRAEINGQREYLLTQKFSKFEKLEQQLYQTYVNRADPSSWIPSLRELMDNKALIVQFLITTEIEIKQEELSIILKNYLSAILDGQKVLRIAYGTKQLEYLIIPSYRQYNRTVSAISEYLNRVLQLSIEVRQVCTINSVEELVGYKSTLASSQDSINAIEISCQYMEEHLAESISRDELATRVFLSPSYFSYLFKKAKGISYSDYFIELRIKHAKELLKKNVTIRDVAEAVGYHDPQYFTDTFTARTGQTPSMYRAEVIKKIMQIGEIL